MKTSGKQTQEPQIPILEVCGDQILHKPAKVQSCYIVIENLFKFACTACFGLSTPPKLLNPETTF